MPISEIGAKQVPTTNRWALMEKTVEVLGPFEELTRVVSAETAATADVSPALTVLKCILS